MKIQKYFDIIVLPIPTQNMHTNNQSIAQQEKTCTKRTKILSILVRSQECKQFSRFCLKYTIVHLPIHIIREGERLQMMFSYAIPYSREH